MAHVFKRHAANTIGHDYVVGDIHGHFSLLEALLAHVGFDTARDRLFSVGDLVDRGPESHRVAAFLRQPWFHAIAGNHEAMMRQGAHTIDYAPVDWFIAQQWMANGGDWFFELSLPDQEEAYYEIHRLPLAAEVALPGGGLAGLVHADVENDSWVAVRALLTRDSHGVNPLELGDALLWRRERAYAVAKGQGARVAGAEVVFFGHTPMVCPLRAANTRWLDTGAGQGKRLSLAELAADGRVWTMAVDGRSVTEGWTKP